MMEAFSNVESVLGKSIEAVFVRISCQGGSYSFSFGSFPSQLIPMFRSGSPKTWLLSRNRFSLSSCVSIAVDSYNSGCRGCTILVRSGFESWSTQGEQVAKMKKRPIQTKKIYHIELPQLRIMLDFVSNLRNLSCRCQLVGYSSGLELGLFYCRMLLCLGTFI